MSNLDSVIKGLAKKYGIHIRGPGSNELAQDVDIIPTGILPIDVVLGIGGIPRAHFTEIYAPEGIGKTTLALHIVASAQSAGLKAAYVDVEGRIDPAYASAIGVSTDLLYVISPPHGDAALEATRAFVSTGEIGLVVVDSVAALVPKMELEGDVSDQFPGLQARLMSKYLRQMTPDIKKHNTAIVFTNQIRYKIMHSYGSPETRPGGVALGFYASILIDMRRAGWLSDSNGEKYGATIKVETRKNSFAAPYRAAKVPMIFGKGFSNQMAILEMAESIGIVTRAGSWYKFGDLSVQGKVSMVNAMYDDPDITAAMARDVSDHYGIPMNSTCENDNVDNRSVDN